MNDCILALQEVAPPCFPTCFTWCLLEIPEAGCCGNPSRAWPGCLRRRWLFCPACSFDGTLGAGPVMLLMDEEGPAVVLRGTPQLLVREGVMSACEVTSRRGSFIQECITPTCQSVALCMAGEQMLRVGLDFLVDSFRFLFLWMDKAELSSEVAECITLGPCKNQRTKMHWFIKLALECWRFCGW